MLRAPITRLLTALMIAILGAAAVPLLRTAAEASTSVHARQALRVSAAMVFARREAARNSSEIAPVTIRSELLAVADSLEVARLDTLAAQALYKAAGVGSRMFPRPAIEADLERSIRLAIRARSPVDEL